MYQSVFDYTLTRKYPYRWFTWVVVVGGIAATALFSVVNVAANGFDLNTEYVINPNETEHPQVPAWYQKMPWSLISKVSTVCQDQTITVGSRFQTNNARIHYTMSQINPLVNSQQQPNTSLAYHNDKFHDCYLSGLSITSQFDGLQINSTIKCAVNSRQGPVNVTMTHASSSLDPNEGQNRQLDNRTDSALWWAEYLLKDLRQSVSAGGRNSNKSYVNGFVFGRQDDAPADLYINRARVLGEFPFRTYQCKFKLPQSLDKWTMTFGADIITSYQWDAKNPGEYDTLILDIDTLAKVTYSYLMTDLGQDAEYNMFAVPHGVMDYFNQSSRLMRGETYPYDFHSCSSTVPRRSCDYSFDDPSHQNVSEYYEWVETGIPKVGPAFINTVYTCQVPTLKPVGSLILSVVIGDLVLLQVLWMVFTWAVKMFLERGDNSQANCCIGCVSLQAILDKASPGLISENPARSRGGAQTQSPPMYSKSTRGSKIPWYCRVLRSCMRSYRSAFDWIMNLWVNLPTTRLSKKRRRTNRVWPNRKRRAKKFDTVAC